MFKIEDLITELTVQSNQTEIQESNPESIQDVPFPEYLPGWTVRMLLFMEDSKWKNKMTQVYKLTATRFSMKTNVLLNRVYVRMYETIELSRQYYILHKGRQKNATILDWIACQDSSKKEFMKYTVVLIQFLKETYGEKEKKINLVISSAERKTEEEYLRIIATRYRIIRKKKRGDDEYIADLRAAEPMIRKRKAAMNSKIDYILELRGDYHGRKPLWQEVCRRMPIFTTFCNELGEMAQWHGYFGNKSKGAIICVDDEFYTEFMFVTDVIIEEEKLRLERKKRRNT